MEKCDSRGTSKDFRNEQAVPGAPCREVATVHFETMMHGRRCREAAKAEDQPPAICVDDFAEEGLGLPRWIY